MPNPRPLALALGLALATTLLAMPAADAAKKKKSTKKAEVSLVCSDFYSHANADWLAANKVAADSGMVSALGQLGERARQQQIDLLDDDMRSAQGGVAKLLGDFWASGLDEAAVERDGAVLDRHDARGRGLQVRIVSEQQFGHGGPRPAS